MKKMKLILAVLATALLGSAATAAPPPTESGGYYRAADKYAAPEKYRIEQVQAADIKIQQADDAQKAEAPAEKYALSALVQKYKYSAVNPLAFLHSTSTYVAPDKGATNVVLNGEKYGDKAGWNWNAVASTQPDALDLYGLGTLGEAGDGGGYINGAGDPALK